MSSLPLRPPSIDPCTLLSPEAGAGSAGTSSWAGKRAVPAPEGAGRGAAAAAGALRHRPRCGGQPRAGRARDELT